MNFVYILQSIIYPKRFYTGLTKNIETRINDHNKGKSAYTSKYKPWKLISYFYFENKDTAINFEKYLKTSSGIAFRNKRLL